MYWFRKSKTLSGTALHILLLFAGTAVLFSCGSGSSDTTATKENTYFDTKAFFDQELERLHTEKPEILKTVKKDQEEETKSVTIKDWKTELTSFLEVDLKKPVYNGEFIIEKKGNTEIYRSQNPELDIQEVILLRKEGEIQEIQIHKQIGNMLYKTRENLVYNKVAYYRIEKEQNIRVMGTNHYTIQGNFKKQ